MGLSLNVMALCGASLKVFALATDCPGSWHDSRVFEESELFHLLNSGRYLPFENAVILADSAYKVCIIIERLDMVFFF